MLQLAMQQALCFKTVTSMKTCKKIFTDRTANLQLLFVPGALCLIYSQWKVTIVTRMCVRSKSPLR